MKYLISELFICLDYNDLQILYNGQKEQYERDWLRQFESAMLNLMLGPRREK